MRDDKLFFLNIIGFWFAIILFMIFVQMFRRGADL